DPRIVWAELSRQHPHHPELQHVGGSEADEVERRALRETPLLARSWGLRLGSLRVVHAAQVYAASLVRGWPFTPSGVSWPHHSGWTSPSGSSGASGGFRYRDGLSQTTSSWIRGGLPT